MRKHDFHEDISGTSYCAGDQEKRDVSSTMMIYKMCGIMIAVFVLAVFASCATKQQPAGAALEAKSYSEIWLDKRIIQIDFKGKNDEQVDRMKNLAVLRAAVIGKERGLERFVILNTTDQTIIDGVLRSGDQYLPIEKLKVSVIVKFVDKTDPEYPQAFDVEAKIVEIRKYLDT